MADNQNDNNGNKDDDKSSSKDSQIIQPQIPHDDCDVVKTAAQKSPARVDDEMQRVLLLIAARTRGEVSNDVVEAAVSHLLQSTGCASAAATAATTQKPAEILPIHHTPNHNIVSQSTKLQQQQPTTVATSKTATTTTTTTTTKIIADDDDYDNNDKNGDYQSKKEADQGASILCKRPRESEQATIATNTPVRRCPRTFTPSKGKGEKNDEYNDDGQQEEDEEEDLLDQIPLGRQGAKMMTTFGDGSHPRADVVAATLLGARHMIQVAIRDARATRRRDKQHFELAKVVTMAEKKTSLATHAATAAIDSTMIFRAMEGYDKLAYDPKCGFDMEQLRVLFPEEMNAYGRWSEMHSEYVASTVKNEEQQPVAMSPKREALEEQKQHPEEEQHGHLQERVAQFDARTRIMKDDWYLKFAVMRRGSFLPRNKINDDVVVVDDDVNADGNNGEVANWENRPAPSIRFLHWVGFDPRSALSPPSEQITHALAFLCHDFFGRIVEKAVLLRNSKRHPDDDPDSLSKELDAGDQLELADIELALQDPEIRPVPLYGALDETVSVTAGIPMATQLYFGPGFEERLELEMEGLLPGPKNKDLSEEELKLRLEEDALFDKLRSPPSVERVGGHLLEDI